MAYKETICKDEKYKGFAITYRKNRYGAVTSSVAGIGGDIYSGSSKVEVSKRTKRLIDMYIKGRKTRQANRR